MSIPPYPPVFRNLDSKVTSPLIGPPSADRGGLLPAKDREKVHQPVVPIMVAGENQHRNLLRILGVRQRELVWETHFDRVIVAFCGGIDLVTTQDQQTCARKRVVPNT